MAHLKGDKGKVTYAGTDVATTKSWTCTITKELVEITRQGSAERTYIPSFVTATGSATIVYDASASSSNDAFGSLMEASVNNTTNLGTAEFKFFPDRNNTSKFLQFTGYVIGVDSSAVTDELQELTINFQSNGAVVQSI